MRSQPSEAGSLPSASRKPLVHAVISPCMLASTGSGTASSVGDPRRGSVNGRRATKPAARSSPRAVARRTPVERRHGAVGGAHGCTGSAGRVRPSCPRVPQLSCAETSDAIAPLRVGLLPTSVSSSKVPSSRWPRRSRWRSPRVRRSGPPVLVGGGGVLAKLSWIDVHAFVHLSRP